MIKAISVMLTMFSIFTWGCGEKTNTVATSVATVQHDADTLSAQQVPQTSKSQIPDGARRIIEAYPDFQLSYSDNHIIFPDGTRIVYDDHREKSFVVKLDDCDIEDMFSMTYDTNVWQPEYLEDAGRGRCEQLFKKMYGKSEAEARRNLVRVNWFGQRLPFTSVNGAARHLEEVAAELAQHPELRKYFDQSSTFYWRTVRGAQRQSAHSYGIAIDLCTKFSNYWLWTNKGAGETDHIRYENKIPRQIVQIFEKHGFIWGGRWYHYDTMHFEYRPEFLIQ
ncbi:MAG: M15 family metallopeptidase [Prevotella sp.]|nr:M15 family metallopeptidase [Prevotella sp.]